MKVYEIPEGSKVSKGRAIQNLINMPKEDKIKAFVAVGDQMDQEGVGLKKWASFLTISATMVGLVFYMFSNGTAQQP